MLKATYNCDLCKYKTDRIYNYNSHLTTTTHRKMAANLNVTKSNNNTNSNMMTISVPGNVSAATVPCNVSAANVPGNVSAAIEHRSDTGIDQCDTKNKCPYCNKILCGPSNRTRHSRQCKMKAAQENDAIVKKLEEELQKERLSKEELLKEQEELKRETEELKREKDDIQRRHNDILESIIKGTIGRDTTMNTINIFYVQNNFDDVHNIEDLVETLVTQPEIDHNKTSRSLIQLSNI